MSDMDECSVSIPVCHATAQCVNTLGSFKCICQVGFKGGLTICTSRLSLPQHVVHVVWGLSSQCFVGGAVPSWLVRSSPDRAVRVRALAGDTVLCSWARHLTLTVPLSTQEYKWVPANCWGNLTKLQGSDLRWTSIPSRGSRNTPSRFMLRKLG